MTTLDDSYASQAVRTGVADDAATARLVARLSSQYLLRVLRLIADLHGGDIIRAIVFQAIVAANTANVDARNATASSGAYGGGIPSDAVRTPISILALAGSLGLPFETTRRHVKRLIAAGQCRRVRGGLIVPAEVLADPVSAAAAQTNLAYVRRFLRNLEQAGLELA